jgi:hypothetical protein
MSPAEGSFLQVLGYLLSLWYAVRIHHDTSYRFANLILFCTCCVLGIDGFGAGVVLVVWVGY